MKSIVATGKKSFKRTCRSGTPCIQDTASQNVEVVWHWSPDRHHDNAAHNLYSTADLTDLQQSHTLHSVPPHRLQKKQQPSHKDPLVIITPLVDKISSLATIPYRFLQPCLCALDRGELAASWTGKIHLQLSRGSGRTVSSLRPGTGW